MKYHTYSQDEEAGDIAERLNPASEGVGYLVEDRFEAENFEEATEITQEWITQRILSRPRDPGTVFIAELEAGEHRHLRATLPSAEPITEADKDATIVWLKKRCALLDMLGECLRRHYYNDAVVSQTWLDEVRKAPSRHETAGRRPRASGISPEGEAGFIRYLVREGFIEKRWPRLSAHIQEEASWAFRL